MGGLSPLCTSCLTGRVPDDLTAWRAVCFYTGSAVSLDLVDRRQPARALRLCRSEGGVSSSWTWWQRLLIRGAAATGTGEVAFRVGSPVPVLIFHQGLRLIEVAAL